MADTQSLAQAQQPLRGRACKTCVKAKARCTYGDPEQRRCDRCSRLNRDCQASPPVRKRGMGKEPRASAKVARLEEKLDSLVSLIQAKPQVAGLSLTDSSTTSPESMNSNVTNGSSASQQQATLEVPQARAIPQSDFQSVATALYGTQSTIANTSLDSGSLINTHSSLIAADEAEESLQLFQSQMLATYPIIVLPQPVCAQRLKASSPFLWLVIMAVTQKSTLKQRYLGIEIRRTIAYRVIIEGERNIDLVKGLLVYVAWSQFYIFNKPIITNVIQLAIAMVADLGLHRPVLREPLVLLSEYDTRGCPGRQIPTTRTLDERRAAIVCYSVSQLVSTYFSRTEPLRWSPYLEECAQILSMSDEMSSDKLLIQTARLQVIVSKCFEAPWHNEQVSKDEALKAPVFNYINGLNAELKQYRDNLPEDLRNNDMLTLLSHRTKLLIHEVALPSNCVFTETVLDLKRLDLLWTCLQAVKDWFDVFLQIPASRYIGLPMAVNSSLAHCTIALFRLSTFDCPGWDLRLVQETCHLPTMLDRVLSVFKEVKSVAGLDSETTEDISMFASACKRLAAIKTRCEAKMASHSPVAQNSSSDTWTTQAMDAADEAWLRDILAGGDILPSLSTMSSPAQG